MVDSEQLKQDRQQPAAPPEAEPDLPITAAPEQLPQEADRLRRILESGLFDPDWYSAYHPEVADSGLPPATHYLRIGAAKGYPPSARFDGADYLARYPDIGRSGINPLVHFVSFGRKEGRKANPVDPEAMNARLVTESGLFDENWYRETHPEVEESGLPPVRYFLRHGREHGHNPGPAFDAADYIARYADVASSKINPLLHYLRFGRAEGRTFRSVPVEVRQPSSAAATTADAEHVRRDLLAASELFDAEWYTVRYPEVRESGLDPVLHYLRQGGIRGLAPSPGFDGADYLSRNKDVKAAGVNPLVHYLMTGQKEGRKITPADPEEALVRLIRDSGLFDEAWFIATYPEVSKSSLTPLDHFRKFGRTNALNPGPDFDSAAYIAEHMDDASPTMNPLIHYLMTGRAQGRGIQAVGQETTPTRKTTAHKPRGTATRKAPAKDQAAPPAAAVEVSPSATTADADVTPEHLALIESSPLFDKAWYLARYPEVARLGMPPAEHYLRHGAKEMRQPSVFFDPQYYLVEQCPEIQQTGVNPLLHYLKSGRARGLKPRALFETAGTAEPGRPLSPSAWPLAASGERPEPEPAWVRQAELDARPADDSLFAGRTLLANAVAPDALAEAGCRLVAFSSLCRLGPDAGLRISRAGAREPLPASVFAADGYEGLGQPFLAGPACLTDAWYASSHTLRLRLGEEGVTGESHLVLRAFQCAPNDTGPQLVGEALVRPSAPSFADLTLADPLMPVLLVLSATDGQAQHFGLLPFPSLCRGGLHHAELAGQELFSDPIGRLRNLADALVRSLLRQPSGERPFLLNAISVSLKGATGNEPLFAAGLSGWLNRVFGLSLTAGPARHDETPGERHLRVSLASRQPPQSGGRAGTHDLLLPHDAIPALSALAAPGDCSSAGPWIGRYFVTDAGNLRPRLAVHLPGPAVDLQDLQPPWAPLAFPLLTAINSVAAESGSPSPLPPLAIRFAAASETHRAAMLMPLAPDAGLPVTGNAAAAGLIDVVIRSSGNVKLDTLLSSLDEQQDISLGAIRVELAGRADVEAVRASLELFFPGRGEVHLTARHGAVSASIIAEGTSAGYTLVVDGGVVLHDPRTLSTLLGVVRTETTASASCVLLREVAAGRGTAISFESGGYFPSRVSLIAAPHLMLSLPDVRGALPNAVYPVIANDPALLLVSNSALRDCGSIEAGTHAPGDNLGFSLAALARGYRHLCVSAVRATCIGKPPPREASDPPGISSFPPGIWQAVLGAAAVIREL